ncbi:hypothetical protein CI238_12754 [Colletotrichum incanum]|uniref:Uncharacterized protein n=1 Tax=Colletotrichum incanum TaxID=1573173 RepID=A0A161W3G2_COLIC|nr:hypothetical protein CI238_12754 [Colletotrichum incanum]OHW96922.1 hypothetical protein CSPAE12_04512 [Colletotrichum incanum]
MRSLTSVGGVVGGSIDNSNRNTPSRCNNLATASGASTSSPRHDLTSKSPSPPPHTSTTTITTRPQQNKLHHQKHLLQKQQPDSSRTPKRNIRPSISPAIRNPATSAHQTQSTSQHPSATSATPAATSTSTSSLASSSPAAVAAKRTPVVVQPRTTNNPTSTNSTKPAADLPLPSPTPTTTTTTTRTPPTAAAATGPPTTTGPRRITAAATASTTTKTTTTTTSSSSNPNSNSNPNTTTSSPSPPTTSTPTPPAIRPSSAASRRQQPALSSSLRTPLRTRDQNVLNPSRPTNAARAKPSPTPSPTSSASASASSTPTMPPYEKGGSTTTRQPAMPSLSAKAMGRTPLTPKVAAKPSPVVTPLGRRRNDNSSNNNHHPPPHANGGGARDDLTSPAPFLAATNITPRSGSRQSRVNSANTTPNGTPNPDRNEWDRQPTLEPPRRQVVTFSPPSSVSSRNDAPESKFFYASEAKPSQPAPQPKAQSKSMAPAQRGSTFMYANGSAVEKNRPTSPGVGFTPVLAPSLAPSLSPSIAPTPEPLSSKFFYANGAPNLQPGFRPSSAASGTGSVTSGSGKLHRTSAGSAGGFQMAQRPLSPNKPAQPPTSAPLLKSNSMPPHTVGRAQMTSPPPLAPSSHKRRTSTDTVSQVASYVGSEAPATDAMIMSRFMASQTSTPSEMPSPTAPSFFSQQPITIASIIQAADDLEDEDSADESKDLDDLHSPTKSSHGEPLNDMVLNARRERKVQDLEITNASLEAINRSLERQLRKQTAELRRYKRLSRSGRLSVPTSATSSRVPSETQPGGLGIDGLDLSDLSEEEAEGDLEDMDDSMFESSELSETDSTSPASPKQDTDRDIRRRTRDEKRLRLDLSKHRELLVDSQKINQSIKRCLNWTEELIKEGKKALEYNVRPSDVELPPRVLRPAYLEENEDEERGQRNEFSVSLPSSPLESPRSLSPHWSKEPQDRDSGIELPADGG